jgi:Mg-chelatase subunit ChlD
MGNQLELNKGDNIIFLADISRSMGATDCPGGLSRSDYLKESLKTFVNEAAKYDDDGIDLITFGVNVVAHPKLTPASAESLINALGATEGATNTAGAIAKAWELHKQGGYDQTVVMVATDGEPSDENAVFKTIAEITQNLTKGEHEFAITFLTVGQRSPSLQAFLTKLDDDLPGAKYDIVDVKEFDKVNFAQAFDGALHD